MDCKPVIVKPLKSKHSLPEFSQKLNALMTLFDRIKTLQNMQSLDFWTPLLEKEAYFALQNTKIHHSLNALKSSSAFKDHASIKFYNYLETLKKISRMKKKRTYNSSFFCMLHKGIQKDLSKHLRDLGKLRKRQNWIGPEGCNKEEAYFFPPEARFIKHHLDALNDYLHSSKDHPLIKLALFFAQFLIIHPFMDGNGRVIRSIVGLYLKDQNFLSYPVFGISEYLKKNRLRYFETLYLITEKSDFIPWIRFFLNGLKQSATNQLSLMRKLMANKVFK